MNILLVEDSEEVSFITVEYLNELGHQAVVVADAETAIPRVRDTSFDAVMTDVGLPGMSGVELARALRKDFPHLPIIICTGYSAQSLQSQFGDKMGSIVVLTKPYDLQELESTLARAVAGAG
jgi:CheY-like chemotaxis protein